MTQPVQEPSQGRTDQAQDFRSRQLFRRPATGTGGGACGEWQTPTLINGWSNTGPPFCDAAYRQCPFGLQFRGHIEGGADGTVAFVLDPDFWPDCDESTITDVISTPPGAAQLYISSSDGSVTVNTIV